MSVLLHRTSINSVSLFFTALFIPSFSYPNPDPGQTLCIPLQGNILCFLSGVVLLLIGSYWPIAYCWKIRQSRNFTMLGCYSCVLSVLIVSCVVALMVTMAFSATMFQCFDPFQLVLLLLWELLFSYFCALVFVVCVVVATKLVEFVSLVLLFLCD